MKTGILFITSIILFFTAGNFAFTESAPFSAAETETIIHEEETENIKIHNFDYDEDNERLKFSVYNKGEENLNYNQGHTLERRDNQGKWLKVPVEKVKNTYSFSIKPLSEHDSFIPIPSPGTYRITKRYESEKVIYDAVITFVLTNDYETMKIKGDIKTVRETLN